LFSKGGGAYKPRAWPDLKGERPRKRVAARGPKKGARGKQSFNVSHILRKLLLRRRPSN